MHVLIVDDDAGIRETLSVMLREEGYEVSEATNGVDALQQMRATHEQMIVLLDMWMPHMSGEETLQAVHRQSELWGRVSFIVITANPQRMSARMRAILDCHDIPLLVKPFDIDPLVDVVARSAARLARVAVRRA